MKFPKSTAAIIISLFSGHLAAEFIISGRVFLDSNHNGIMDRSEMGIGGVSVSNGRDVIQTTQNGSYKMSLTEGDILFITKPPSYEITLNENNLPQFYYIHQPAGTPERFRLRFHGIPGSQEAPDEINFPLLPSKKQSRIKMVALADPQPLNDREIDFLRDDVITELIDIDADFAIVAGDIMHDDLSLYPRYNRLMSQLGIPVWNVPGNHDINFESPDDTYSLETFKRFYGPSYYSFEYGNKHFIVLDNVEYNGRDSNKNPYQYRLGGKYRGYVNKDQLTWLRNDLKQVPEDMHIVIISHIPMFSRYWDHETVNTGNRQEVFTLLHGRERVLFLAGHTHTTDHQFISKKDGWLNENPAHQHILTTASGSWWQGPLDERGIPTTPQNDGSPNGYHIYTFTEDSYSFQYKGAGKPADYQCRIYLDEEYHNHDIRGLVYSQLGEQGRRISQEHLFSSRIVVNVFSGTPRDSVFVSIDNSTLEPLKQVEELPPWYIEYQTRQIHQIGEKLLSKASLTNHLWVGKLPEDLIVGTHRLDVKVTTYFGNNYSSSLIFEVVVP